MIELFPEIWEAESAVKSFNTARNCLFCGLTVGEKPVGYFLLIQLLLLEQQRLKDAMCHCLHPWDGAWRWKNVLWVGKLPQCLFSQQKTPTAALLPPDTVRCLLALRPLSDFIAGDIPWQCPLCPQ